MDLHILLSYADTTHHELSGYGTGIDLRNTQRALAIAPQTEPGQPEERLGSLAFAPRRSEAARRGQLKRPGAVS